MTNPSSATTMAQDDNVLGDSDTAPPLFVPVRLLAHDEENDDHGDEILFEGPIARADIPERMWAYQSIGVPDLIEHNGRLFQFCGDGCTSDTGGYLIYHEVFACAAPGSQPRFPWPDTASLTMPRQDDGSTPAPVLDAMSLICQPWVLQNLAHVLRARGMPIPRRAEAEMAVATHWLIGFALRSGADWREAADRAIRRLEVPADPPSVASIPCPYCGAACDSSAVGDHTEDCAGYGPHADIGMDPEVAP